MFLFAKYEIFMNETKTGQPGEKLLNQKCLAEAMGVGVFTVWGMKQAGYQFTHGLRTFKSDALRWLSEHPDFRASHYLKRSRQRRASSPASSSSTPPGSPGDRSDAPSLTSGQPVTSTTAP